MTARELQPKVLIKPCLVAVLGQSGVGKTTLCQELVKESNFDHFDIEDTKRKLVSSTLAPFIQTLGYDPNTRLPSHLERLVMRASYALNHTIAGLHLESNKPVLISATYSHPSYQAMLKEIPEVTGKPLIIVNLHTDEETLNRRISSRSTDPSNISAVTDLYTATLLRSSYTPMIGPEVHNLESNRPPLVLAQIVLEILASQGLILSQ